MKKFFLLTAIVTVSFSVLAQNQYEKDPYMTKSLSSESVKSTEVQTSGGSISVMGVNSAAETKVEVYVSPNGNRQELSKAEIDQRLKEMYDLSITVSNNKLIATAKSKERITDWRKALNISFATFARGLVEKGVLGLVIL